MSNINADTLSQLSQFLATGLGAPPAPAPAPAPAPESHPGYLPPGESPPSLYANLDNAISETEDMYSPTGAAIMGFPEDVATNVDDMKKALDGMINKRVDLQNNINDIGKTLSQYAYAGKTLDSNELAKIAEFKDKIHEETRAFGQDMININKAIAKRLDEGNVPPEENEAIQGLRHAMNGIVAATDILGLVDPTDLVGTALGAIGKANEYWGEAAVPAPGLPAFNGTVIPPPLDMSAFNTGLDGQIGLDAENAEFFAGVKEGVNRNLDSMSEFARRGSQEATALAVMADLSANGIGDFTREQREGFSGRASLDSTIISAPKLDAAANALEALGYTVGRNTIDINPDNHTFLNFWNADGGVPSSPTGPVGFANWDRQIPHNVPGVNDDHSIRPNLLSPTSPTTEYLVAAMMGDPLP